MKVLFKKLGKCNKGLLITFILSFLIYLASLIFFTINILKLAQIETVIRIVALSIFYLLLLGYLIGGLLTLITKRTKTLIVCTIIVLLFSGVFCFASYYIDKTINKIDNISKEYVTYTSNLITLKDTDENDIDSIGIISDTDDVEGFILAQEIIKEENIDEDIIKEYDDYYEMLTALYAKELDAVFVTSNYSVIFSSEELFANIKEDTKVIAEYSKKMENKDKLTADDVSSKKLTEPFTILLLGVDSEKDGLNANQAFNGDTLMMITFNPNTMNATMFSIPRDTYVPIACRNGAENKINSSAASGTKCVIDTVEDLTDIDIDYYVKVNFKGVVDLVEALGGVEVDVPISFCEQDSNRQFGSNTICLEPGLQTLNGEEALAFSRHRKTLPRGDFQRVEHQQMVVEGIAKKAKNVRSVNDFYSILDAISKNIDTNMTTQKMLSFYNVFKKMLTTSLQNNTDFITIDHTYLTGSDLTMYNPSTRMNMYTFQYNRSSLKEIVDLMKVNLELQEPEHIKTFNFSINEEYEQKVAGNQNVQAEATEELLPDFTNSTIGYVQSWANARNISLRINYIEQGDPKYNKNKANGIVVGQNVNARTLVSNIKSLTVDVIRHDENDDETNINIGSQKSSTKTDNQSSTTTPSADDDEQSSSSSNDTDEEETPPSTGEDEETPELPPNISLD